MSSLAKTSYEVWEGISFVLRVFPYRMNCIEILLGRQLFIINGALISIIYCLFILLFLLREIWNFFDFDTIVQTWGIFSTITLSVKVLLLNVSSKEPNIKTGIIFPASISILSSPSLLFYRLYMAQYSLEVVQFIRTLCPINRMILFNFSTLNST